MAKVHINKFFIIGSLFLLVLNCSSSKVNWYKNGSGLADFNIDDVECKQIGEAMGREASLSGRRIVRDVYADAYEACLYNRGWSTIKPQTNRPGAASGQLTPVASFDNFNITAFDKTLAIPPGFILKDDKTVMLQGGKSQFTAFQNNEGIFLHLVFQQNTRRLFKEVDFPVNEPFFLYDQGEAKSIRWAVFSGIFEKDWVAGIGGYYLIDSKRRIVMTVTSAISPPQTKPPEELRLTKIQKDEIDEFHNRWIEYLKTAFGGCPQCK